MVKGVKNAPSNIGNAAKDSAIATVVGSAVASSITALDNALRKKRQEIEDFERRMEQKRKDDKRVADLRRKKKREAQKNKNNK